MSAVNVSHAVVMPPSALHQQRLDVHLRQLEFHALLYRKLDLELLFECLLTEGQAFLSFDGVQFIAASRGTDVLLGELRQHKQRFALRLGERLLGEIILMRGKPFSVREEREAERLVEGLAYPLDNALEYHAVVMRTLTDSATGLRNQQALDIELPGEIRLARRVEQPLVLLMLSVDELESIHENHGQEVGEQVWQAVAKAIASGLRRSDLTFRTQSDAFCIILHNSSLEGAQVLAARLSNEANRCVRHDNVQLVLTVSAGIAELAAADTAESLLSRCELALKRARQNGRNQIHVLQAESGASDAPHDPGAA